MRMNLVERILNEMLTDEEPREKQSQYLRRTYETANEAERARLDHAFIALCGWSLATLIASSRSDEEEE
jgi:hypothetical protein